MTTDQSIFLIIKLLLWARNLITIIKGNTCLKVGGRADGSSRFATAEQWGFFPYGSAGYRISEEQFWKDSPLKFINNFKLRASYGIQGDENFQNNQFIAGFTYPATGTVFTIMCIPLEQPIEV